jgi:hypothetical protein
MELRQHPRRNQQRRLELGRVGLGQMKEFSAQIREQDIGLLGATYAVADLTLRVDGSREGA